MTGRPVDPSFPQPEGGDATKNPSPRATPSSGLNIVEKWRYPSGLTAAVGGAFAAAGLLRMLHRGRLPGSDEIRHAAVKAGRALHLPATTRSRSPVVLRSAAPGGSMRRKRLSGEGPLCDRMRRTATIAPHLAARRRTAKTLTVNQGPARKSSKHNARQGHAFRRDVQIQRTIQVAHTSRRPSFPRRVHKIPRLARRLPHRETFRPV